MSKKKDDKITQLHAEDGQGQPLTEEELNNMSEDELNEILAQPVAKGEVINLVRNLVGVEIDAFRKFIGEPLRVMSVQNLALIELAKDKGLIESEADLQPYFDKVREQLKESEGEDIFDEEQEDAGESGTEEEGRNDSTEETKE